MRYISLASLLLFFFNTAVADAVKPALTEITVNAKGYFSIEIKASIEALLTGINGQYKNTQDAPNAAHYDELRALPPDLLRERFTLFQDEFSESIKINFDQKDYPVQVSEVDIPEVGYPKVPRISTIILTGNIDRNVKQVKWYYPIRFGDQAVRVRQVDEELEKWHWSSWQWIRTDTFTKPYDLTAEFHKQSIWQVVNTYTVAGFYHILPYGIDHILFISGLFLFSRKMSPLLWQVTMFTVAHSITLALAMLGIFQLPPQVVEPLIAFTIIFVAIENLYLSSINRFRLIIVFCFGLLHGMGFASVLSDFGMPADDFIKALISFNVGVELGQLTIIVGLYLLVSRWFKSDAVYRRYIVIPASLSIAAVALYWFWERLDVAYIVKMT